MLKFEDGFNILIVYWVPRSYQEMDMLPALPAKVLDGIEQQCNGFVPKCASRYPLAGECSRSKALALPQCKSSPHAKPNKSLQSSVTSRKAFDDESNDFSRSLDLDASCGKSVAASVLDYPNVDTPVKKIAKKKYRKKRGKSNKKVMDGVIVRGIEVVHQTCSIAGIGSTHTTPIVNGDCIAAVSYQSTEKKIGNVCDYSVSPNCKRKSSFTTSSSELHLGAGDMVCFSSTNEATCRRVVERAFPCYRETISNDPTVDECNIGYTSNSEKNTSSVLASTITKSLSCYEPVVTCLNGGSECDGQFLSEVSSGGNSDVLRVQTQCDVFDRIHGKACTCGVDQIETIHGGKELNPDRKEISSDNRERFSFGCISEDKLTAKESANSDGADRIKCSNQCSASSIRDVPAVTPATNIESGRKPSSNETIAILGQVNDHIQTVKDNSRSFWRKNRKNISYDTRFDGAKRSVLVSVQADLGSQEAPFLVNNDSSSSDPLLPSPAISSIGQNAFNQKFKEVVNGEKGMHGAHTHALVESTQWVAQERFRGGNYPYILQSRQDIVGNGDWRNPKEKANQSSKPENTNRFRKGSWATKGSLYKLHNKENPSQRWSSEVSTKPCLCRSAGNDEFCCSPSVPAYPSHLQANASHGRILSGQSDQVQWHVVQTHTWMKLLSTEHVMAESLHAPLESREKRPACLEIELSDEGSVKQDSASRVNLQKWIPVGRKQSWIVKGTVNVNDIKGKPVSYDGKAGMHHEIHTNSVSVPVPLLDHGLTSLSSNPKGSTSNTTSNAPRTERAVLQLDELSNDIGNSRKDNRSEDISSDCKPRNVILPQFYIGSQMAMQTLNEAYRLQMASESVQLATGSPLAGFERLLHSASPVIFPASNLQHCEECSGNQVSLNNCLCRHQIPNVPLGTVWNWYEQPGSYGMEVKAEDSNNLKGLDADGISFHAHFVPFLSAVQLFRHLCDSKCKSTEKLSFEVQDKGEAEHFVLQSKIPMEISGRISVEPNPSDVENKNVFVCRESAENSSNQSNSMGSDVKDSSDLSLIFTCSDDIEVIFEFFEYEQPQQRKPLYGKIMELIKLGPSNREVFGDPSKLKCMNLHDLHPASWYSVAWYPIYRIPEGNFRASFLTYHSLGYLVQRCTLTDPLEENSSCVVSPVLGLQSYNTQDECWFYPKKPPNSSSKGLPPFNTSEILEEQLRTLEQNAFLYARGCVYKDKVKVVNRQPDYEFFLSRKH